MVLSEAVSSFPETSVGVGGQGTHECLSKLLRLRILISKMRGVYCTEFVGLGGLDLWGIIQGPMK